MEKTAQNLVRTARELPDILPPFQPSESQTFRDVLDAGYFGVRKYRILVPVEFYFDESGTDAKGPAFVVAGYVATTAQWLAFEERWRKTLKDFNVQTFHMHDLEQRCVEFSGWNAETCIALQSRLIEIINQTVMVGLACGISLADYRAAAPPELHADIRFGYLLCFYECLMGIHHYMEGHDSVEPIKLLFDQQAEYSPMMTKVYTRLRRHLGYPDWMVAEIGFADRRQRVPLQAADLFAYEMFKHLTHRAVEPWRNLRKSAAALDTNRYMLKRLEQNQIRAYTQELLTDQELD